MARGVAILAMPALVAVLTAGAAAQDRSQDKSLVIAATTAVEDSGLFEHLVPLFTAKTGITARIASRASATALMTAERGTIDVVIVNDPEALDRFSAAGDGGRRHRFMFNRFIIIFIFFVFFLLFLFLYFFIFLFFLLFLLCI